MNKIAEQQSQNDFKSYKATGTVTAIIQHLE